MTDDQKLLEWKPGRWFRVRTPDGRLWCETSDEAEARAESAATGWPLERLWIAAAEEWRDEVSR